MATTIAPTLQKMEYCLIVLHDVSWETYCRLNDEESNDSIRMTYLDGDLALMSRRLRHDMPIELLGQLVRAVTAGLGIRIMGVRSTTLRREAAPGQKKGAGKEADCAFYLGESERRIRGRENLDLNIDPPPDLAIEVEHTNELTAQAMAVYARIGVPEVWRFRVAEQAVVINRLVGDTYEEVARSVALSQLTPARITEALDRFEVGDFDENAWYEWVKAWVQSLPEPDAAA